MKAPYKEGVSHFYCFIGLNQKKKPNSKMMQLPTYNVWDHSNSKECDLVGDRNQFLEKMDFEKMLFFTAFSSAKMRDESEKQSCVMVAEAMSEWVEKYRVNEV